MGQQPIFKIRIIAEERNETGTADLKLIGHGDDSHKYALKTIEDHPLLPITEWVSYHLCRAIGIPTPDFYIVDRSNGTQAFGSRFETNADQFSPSQPVNEPQLTRLMRLFGGVNSLHVSGIYGLDLFLPNIDRHLNNFLFRLSGKSTIPLAFDFSQAWIILNLPFGMDHWPAKCKSEITREFLRSHGLIAPKQTEESLDKIAALPNSFMRDIISAAPQQWVSSFNKELTIEFWEQKRIDRISIAKTML